MNEYLSLPIPIPPLDKQKVIVNHITAIRQQARQLVSTTLNDLKKASEEMEQILIG